ncbi:hypothetical protein HPB49_001189 [Dermacentor silvarum]|uniref:Uncharacterized protein n=1 Tax=Dermacentor silvarum TaxID=543639 RepID=A0ACB8DI30_DERSI|nr:hypothetical protein HPB49_001189 [Dermacentor silvarum]
MTSATEDARSRWRSQHRWSDAAAAREGAAPFHEQVQVPSWDSEVFSGRGRAPHVAPVWETWLSSDGPTAEEDTASSGSSASACRHYSRHDADSDSTPSFDTHTFSAEGRAPSPAGAPSNLRLVALTALAALLVCAVVATNAKVNRIVLASLDTESPDETRQLPPGRLSRVRLCVLADYFNVENMVGLITRTALLFNHRRNLLTGSLRPLSPGFQSVYCRVRHTVTSCGRASHEMTTQVPTVIASDPEQSNADAYTAAGEGTGAPGITRSRIPDASTFDLGDSGDVGRTAEETPGRSYRRTNKPDCQAVVYTYCPVARREFHYRASVNACWPPRLTPWCSCVLAGSTGSPRAANCEHSCVFGYRPKDACFDTPLQDVSETAWYFEGGRCHLWGFPAGACPSNDSAVFSTAAELRFPFFAHFSVAEGRMRCLRTSAVLDVGHRCLAGDNRFASLADCAEACARTTTR